MPDRVHALRLQQVDYLPPPSVKILHRRRPRRPLVPLTPYPRLYAIRLLGLLAYTLLLLLREASLADSVAYVKD
jgi:hypothetical protein